MSLGRGNLFWGMRFTRRFAPCFVNRHQVLFPRKGQIAVQSHTAITSIVICVANQLRIECESIISRHCEALQTPKQSTNQTK